MKKSHYRHLTPSDRLQIYRLLFEGLSLQEIATKIGFHKSTLYRELERNSTNLGYRPDFASQQYLMRRHSNELKIDRYPNLKTNIVEKLEEGWSPEQMSGRLRHERGHQPGGLHEIIEM